jgi:hypothetical protein
MSYNLGVARLKQPAMILLLVFCALYYLKVNVGNRLPFITNAPTDFSCYYSAARCVLAAQSPYVGTQYTYPPALAFLLTPVALTDYLTARRIWFWCSQAFLLLAAFLTWRGLGHNLTAACSVAGVWALGGAAEVNFALGQMGPLLVLLLVLAYWGGSAAQGAAVAAGFSLKLLPGILAIVPVLRRDWRAVAAMIAVTVALLLLPAVVVSHWGSGPPPTSFWMGTPALLNWSVPAVALRIADPPVSLPQLPHNWRFGNVPEGTHLPRSQQWLSVGIAAAVLLAGLAALVTACRGRLNQAQVPWAAAALISLSVAASPIAWSHYQVLQYPGLALLICHAVNRRKWLLGVCAVLLGAFLYPIPWGVMLDYYIRFSGWTAASPATLYIWTSVTPVVTLLLFGVLLRQLTEASPPRQ